MNRPLQHPSGVGYSGDLYRAERSSVVNDDPLVCTLSQMP